MASKELEQMMQRVSENIQELKELTVAAEKAQLIPSDPSELGQAFMATYGHSEDEIVGMLRGSGDRAAISSVCQKIVMHLEDQVPEQGLGVAGA